MKKILALSLLVTGFLATAAFAATAADNWDNNCAKCHGADGSGNTKMGKKLKLKDYTDAAVQAAMKDEDMFKAIKEGVTADGQRADEGVQGRPVRPRDHRPRRLHPEDEEVIPCRPGCGRDASKRQGFPARPVILAGVFLPLFARVISEKG